MSADVFAEVAREPGVPKPDPILVADAIRRSFGGLAAVDVAHVEVQRNTITALIGPNGAGKTTFFNLLTGFDTPSTGTWHFNGMSMSGASPYKAARRGMVRTFQLTKSLTRMTVIENMRLGATGQGGERLRAAPSRFRWREQEAEITARAEVLLQQLIEDFPDLAEAHNNLAVLLAARGELEAADADLHESSHLGPAAVGIVAWALLEARRGRYADLAELGTVLLGAHDGGAAAGATTFVTLLEDPGALLPMLQPLIG